MDIKIISDDSELQKLFEETKYFDNVTLSDEFKCEKNSKYILVSDKMISFNNFIEQFAKDITEKNIVFYMLSGNPDSKLKSYISILKAKGVICIPPKLTKNQIVERVCKEMGIIKNANRNIAVFLGADAKSGVTMTAQSIAETIATNTDTTVGLLFLNGQPSVDYLKEEKYTTGLDKLKVKIITNVLSPNELIDSCIKQGNLYVLKGAEQIYEARHYHPQHIENLIELASKVFGTLIIDAGCNLGLGMSIGAINSTVNRFLVTTQQDTALRNFMRTRDQVLSELGISTNEFMLIINKYFSSSQLYTPSELANTIYKIPLAGIIPNLDYSWQAERDRNTLLNYNSSEYKRQISELAKLICAQMNLVYKDTSTKKKGFSFFNKE